MSRRGFQGLPSDKLGGVLGEQAKRGLSQKPILRCSSNVHATRERVVEMTFNHAQPDLESIFEAEYDRIARVIAGVIRDYARAEELAVEVFLKWERTPQAHNEGAPGWLYRTALRMALNELRRQRLRSRYERVIAFIVPGRANTPHEIYAAQEDQTRVRTILSALPPRQAELLLLRNNDFSYQELATALNLNPASVGTLLARALEAFRKAYFARYGEERHE